MPRLGSEYYDPGEGEHAVPVQAARQLFLARIEAVAPKVLRALRADVLPPFAACDVESPWLEFFVRRPDIFRDSRLSPDQQPPQSAELVAFLAAFDMWALQWGMTDEWLRQDTLQTLRVWRDNPQIMPVELPVEEPDLRRLHFQTSGYGGEDRGLGLLPFAPFEPVTETWARFEARNAKWMQRNREVAEELARENGLVPSPVKRARSNNDPYQHFEWLVRVHVEGWNYDKITQVYGPDGDDLTLGTVKKALETTAQLIGLTLRK